MPQGTESFEHFVADPKVSQMHAAGRKVMLDAQLGEWLVQLPWAARHVVETAAGQRPLAIDFGHPLDRDERVEEGVHQQCSPIGGFGEFDGIIDITDDADSRRRDIKDLPGRFDALLPLGVGPQQSHFDPSRPIRRAGHNVAGEGQGSEKSTIALGAAPQTVAMLADLDDDSPPLARGCQEAIDPALERFAG